MNLFTQLFNLLFNKKHIPKAIVKNETTIIDQTKIQEVKELLSKHKRTTYIPVVEERASNFSSASKYGGYPYIRNENDWPICENCYHHMQHFVQINMQEIPINKENYLLQLFYCTNNDCESKLDSYLPFSKGAVCRKIKFEKESAIISPNLHENFPEKLITDWKATIDYPHPDEFVSLNIEIDFEVYYFLFDKEICKTVNEDKLFGWPYWIQNIEYPYDRNTQKQMELVFQIGDSMHVPFMFGDSGIGHITQSPDNHLELGFGWACC